MKKIVLLVSIVLNANVVFSQNITITPNNVTPTSTLTSYTVGQSYGGGIVFYTYDNGQHGLISATSDAGTGIASYNGVVRVTNATKDGIGAGEMNTMLSIAMQTNDNTSGNFAAKICADYKVTMGGVTYGDWYLPSKMELELLYQKRYIVGGFINGIYWSSTELGGFAWGFWFQYGSSDIFTKNQPANVRPIRRF